ncbi:hypothetical protein COLO4_31912 [Corchorus olitorius]|uniref:Uncharacterized protein n=1 Tax=Corchorus olitorius TaxID=93759 RepID=A0A1R3H3A9_9ROSI|nr:hypothetical protein COLO4_31912 [Corchorus olitorius]
MANPKQVIAATPLHQAMEYETTVNGGAPVKEDHQRRHFECTSHGRSQEVKAATLLHKAMEYETAHDGGAPRRKDRQHRRAFFCDVIFGIYKQNTVCPAS